MHGRIDRRSALAEETSDYLALGKGVRHTTYVHHMLQQIDIGCVGTKKGHKEKRPRAKGRKGVGRYHHRKSEVGELGRNDIVRVSGGYEEVGCRIVGEKRERHPVFTSRWEW